MAKSILSYPSLASLAGRTHVAVIQSFIRAGETKKDILDAYVIARYPEIEAGTLLRENHGATPRTLATPVEVSRAKSLLRKHGNTHYKMADAEMSEASVAARVKRADDSVAAAKERLASAQRKADATKKAATPPAKVA